ncbi:hypothetical protein CfE428DRAFT_3250 [Chthoniobacter flavus Ellin428]|uniref:Uncharacterized protein n=1 Tax=Chthoniobacter flavus Ellin428 TaxID=497964 RepID=B4D2W2_9BACT|nr:hypothetical protein CfE428DRAFT_3250 [Chthoniobacter flavus Ellin428]TCO86835.1 hypothetical protein EV701_12652 [Chthoniobacter flavus]
MPVKQRVRELGHDALINETQDHRSQIHGPGQMLRLLPLLLREDARYRDRLLAD